MVWIYLQTRQGIWETTNFIWFPLYQARKSFYGVRYKGEIIIE